MQKHAGNKKSCSKYEKLPKSCRATCRKPYAEPTLTRTPPATRAKRVRDLRMHVANLIKQFIIGRIDTGLFF